MTIMREALKELETLRQGQLDAQNAWHQNAQLVLLDSDADLYASQAPVREARDAYWAKVSELLPDLVKLALKGLEAATPPADLAELQALMEKATPGPWYHCQPFQVAPKTRTIHGTVPASRVDFISTSKEPVHKRIVVPMEPEDGPGVRSEDMALIAAMRNALPALLAELARLRVDAAEYATLKAGGTVNGQYLYSGD